MLSGVRIFASDIEPIREAVPDFLHGNLFSPGDSAGAADLLLTRIKDSGDDVTRARAWATDYYNPSRNFERRPRGARRVTRKLLFAHDDWIAFDELGLPTSNNYTRHLVDRYRYLADRVTFAVRCNATTRIAWFEDAAISCIPDMKHGRNLARYLLARRSVRELVESHDIVVARLPSLIGSWALRTAWKTRKPVLVEMVGCPWDALWNHSLKGKILAPWFWAKNRRLLRLATHTVYVTERFLQERYPAQGRSVGCSNVEVVRASDVEVSARLQGVSALSEAQPIILATIANLMCPTRAMTWCYARSQPWRMGLRASCTE